MRFFFKDSLLYRTAMLLVMTMTFLSFVPRVEAGLVPTGESVAAAQIDRGHDMAVVQKVLENKMITQRLTDLGYSQDEIQAKLGQLSDGELHALAGQIDALAPSGNALGIVIAILVIILLVIVILKLSDKTISVH